MRCDAPVLSAGQLEEAVQQTEKEGADSTGATVPTAAMHITYGAFVHAGDNAPHQRRHLRI